MRLWVISLKNMSTLRAGLLNPAAVRWNNLNAARSLMVAPDEMLALQIGQMFVNRGECAESAHLLDVLE